MKTRADYVTNSSSSSFVINKKYLDNDQIIAIREHSRLGEKLGIKYSEEAWSIEENSKYIGGCTFMDNFDMREFLEKIDIDIRLVDWGLSDPYDFELIDNEDNWRILLYEDA